MDDAVFIVAAKRTPQGRLLGGLAKQSAVDLAVAAGQAAMNGVDVSLVDQVIVGNVLGAGLGMNVARQVALRLGLPEDRPAFTVNMACGSGMLAVRLAAQAIRSGESETVLCGGTESMTNVPYLVTRARKGYKLGDGVLTDAILSDGLTDAITKEHMGATAERLANEYGVTREMQDAFAALSQQRAAAAWRSDVFSDQVISVDGLEQDEQVRPDTTVESLAQLRPVFDDNGTVTAGNASGINDGAAMLLVASREAVALHKWEPMAIIEGSSIVGCDPKRMGLGPVYATRQLVKKLKCTIDEFDLIEINEAFASQVLACLSELGLAPDAEQVNSCGGAIALGHPIGASGARLVVHLAHMANSGSLERGLATLCIGGGMGCAMSIRRCDGA